MSTFRSFVIKDNNGKLFSDVVLENTENLPKGDVLVKVMYYKLCTFFKRKYTVS